MPKQHRDVLEDKQRSEVIDAADPQERDDAERRNEHGGGHFGGRRPAVPPVAHPRDHRHRHGERHDEQQQRRCLV